MTQQTPIVRFNNLTEGETESIDIAVHGSSNETVTDLRRRRSKLVHV